jgi:hypothetical protein
MQQTLESMNATRDILRSGRIDGINNPGGGKGREYLGWGDALTSTPRTLMPFYTLASNAGTSADVCRSASLRSGEISSLNS